MENRVLRSRYIKLFIGAVLLTGCSEQPTDCETFDVENIWFAELEERFPTKIGTNLEAADWVDSSQFKAECLYLQRPEFHDGMDYAETQNLTTVRRFIFLLHLE